jgi:hypothetical protein
MDPISLAILAVNGLSTVLRNPALGGGSSVRLDQAAELLGILGTLLQEGDEAIEELKIFTKAIEDMVKEGRAPTKAEWDVLRTRSDDAHARLQKAKAALLPDPQPEPEPEPEVTEEPAPEPSPAVETLPPEEPVIEPPEEEDPPVTG